MTDLALVTKATVILSVALVATRAARNARASVRSLILASAFGLALILPVASGVAPARELHIPDDYAPAFLLQDLNSPSGAVNPPARLADVPPPPELRFPSVASLLRAAWLLGALATMAPLLTGLWRLRTIRKHSRAWAEGRDVADALRTSLGVRRGVAVVMHDALSAPMTCGWLRPAIAMPADAPNWPTSEIRQALLHELEHVRRYDWPVHVVAQLTCSSYWFHTAAWIAWRRLRLESERACDDAVVAQAEEVAYAQQLVTLARRFGTSAAPLLSMADRRTLATRVAAILNRNVPRGRASAVAIAFVLTGATILAAAIAPITPVQPGGREANGASAFDVATVRLNTSRSEVSRGPMVQPGNRLIAQNVMARALIMTAYGLRHEQVVDGPAWLETTNFDVEAHARDGALLEDIRAMLQTLLRERFGLRAHRESREQPLYALMPSGSRNPPGLRVAAEGCTPVRPPARRIPAAPMVSVGTESEPLVALGSEARCQRMFFPGFVGARHITMADFAASLTPFARRIVVDRTGMTGEYDIDLVFTPDAGGTAGDSVSLFTAVGEQLGLKLEPIRGPVDVLVIDAVDRPTPNY